MRFEIKQFMVKLVLILMTYPFIFGTNTVYKKSVLENLINIANSRLDKKTCYNNCNMNTNGEFLIMSKLICAGDVVIDVGANVGEWSLRVLEQTNQNIKLYAIEPVPSTYKKLCFALKNYIAYTYNMALGDIVGNGMIYCFSRDSSNTLASLFDRSHSSLQIQDSITIPIDTLDSFCERERIEHINYLKIDTEGGELAVLIGAQKLVNSCAIDCIQFEYGGTYRDANITLRKVYTLLSDAGYVVALISPDGLLDIDEWDDSLENYQYSNFLAMSPFLKNHKSGVEHGHHEN